MTESFLGDVKQDGNIRCKNIQIDAKGGTKQTMRQLCWTIRS